MTDNPIQKNHCEYYPCDIENAGDFCPLQSYDGLCTVLETAFAMIDCVERDLNHSMIKDNVTEKGWSILQSLRRIRVHIEQIKMEIEG